MGTPYLGEIRLFSFNNIPSGWAECNGQLLQINRTTQALFQLLGTTYGGDGTTTFGLPNLMGCTPINMGQRSGFSNYVIGQTGGEAAHVLTGNEIPSHTHSLTASSNSASVDSPSGNLWAVLPDNAYNVSANTKLSPASLANTGSNQGHDNMAPYLTLNFCISLMGIFPSRN